MDFVSLLALKHLISAATESSELNVVQAQHHPGKSGDRMLTVQPSVGFYDTREGVGKWGVAERTTGIGLPPALVTGPAKLALLPCLHTFDAFVNTRRESGTHNKVTV